MRSLTASIARDSASSGFMEPWLAKLFLSHAKRVFLHVRMQFGFVA